MRRTGLTLVIAAVTALVVPGAAAAHGVPGIDYRFPLPVWLYGLGAGLAVLLSVPAAAFAGRAKADRFGRDFYQTVRRLRPGWVAPVLAAFVALDVCAGGLFGPDDFFENPATIVVWVDFWVGLGIVSALVGNLWDFVSPLNAAARLLDRALARRARRRFPTRSASGSGLQRPSCSCGPGWSSSGRAARTPRSW